MNLLLLFPEDFDGDPPGPGEAVPQVATIDGRRLRHVREVLHAEVGDDLVVGLVGDRIGSAKITSMGSTSLQIEVTLTDPPPEPLPLSLILALPRPLVLKRVLIAATSMGVKRIVLTNPRRVDRSFWSSRVVRDEVIREQLILGLEQARDTRIPEVLKRPHFRSFVEEELPDLVKNGVSLIAHPGPVQPRPRTTSRPLHLAVGPEGGFSDYEVEKFESAGFERVSLGDRILRVETAVPVLIASLLGTGDR